MALNNTVTSTATTTSSTTNGDDKARGYVLIGIGILLIGGPIVSLAGWLLSSSSNIAAAACDGDGGTTFYRYWIEHEHRPHAYYWRVLTFLPAVLVVAMCHWVSLRIYLRR